MYPQNRGDLLPTLRTNKFEFTFDCDDACIIASGSKITGMEYVHVDGNCVAAQRSFAKESHHPFKVGNTNYEINFESIKIASGRHLACRLYRNGELFRLQVATGVHWSWTGPLFGLNILLALIIDQTTNIDVTWSYYLVSSLAVVLVDALHVLTHIRISELRVEPVSHSMPEDTGA